MSPERQSLCFLKHRKRKHLFLFPEASKARRHLNVHGNVAAVQRLEVFSFCIIPGTTESSALLFSSVVCAAGETERTGRSGHCLRYCLVFYYKLKGCLRIFLGREWGINIVYVAKEDPQK